MTDPSAPSSFRPRSDALRTTQSRFRRSTSSTLRDARVWGAFQLSGDSRPIKPW